ncbi:uncharacterized protein [Montipora foliosa]|uniref:uncharacterized protein n=1 Tax=Montipora foliosa TaxID=591990 RepID=UPI0035F1946E
MAEPPISTTNIQDPGAGSREEIKSKSFHLFNCDHTFSLESVEKLLKSIEAQVGFDISPVQRYFDLREMADVRDSIIKEHTQMDYAIFVVHANESRLSINEENAGIGYAMIYRALMKKTDEKVIIVIGGDDNYKDEAEKQGSVLSRWAYRKISSQFAEKLMDGRESFIFSWEKEHRPIHEEAMIHFLDPQDKKQKFVPKPIPVLTLEQRGDKTEDDQNPPRGTNPLESLNGLERQTTSEEERKFEAPPDSLKSFEDEKENEPEAEGFVIVEKPSVALLYRNESDLAVIKDVFGDLLSLGISPMSREDPSVLKSLLMSSNPVRSCFVMLTAEDLKKDTRYTELLTTAQSTVEKRIVIILCDTDEVSRDEEQAITETIGGLVGDKGLVLCLKNLPKSTGADLTRSHPNQRKEGAIAKPARESGLRIDTHDVQHSPPNQVRSTIEPPPDSSKSCEGANQDEPVEQNSSGNFEHHDMSSDEPTAHETVQSPSAFFPSYNAAAKDDGDLLGGQGVVLCLKNPSQSAGADVSRSQSCPSNKRPAVIPEKDLKLLLHTRLRHGRISYDKNDVKHREKEWEAPEGMKRDLYKDWNTTVNAEIKIYRNTRNGAYEMDVNPRR